MDLEIKGMLEEHAKTFEAFKQTQDELAKKYDGLVGDKLAKIEKGLDDQAEQKASFEARLAAERKEREELELKFNRLGLSGMSEEAKTLTVEVKSFNNVLAANAAARNRTHQPLDVDGYKAYQAAQDRYLREGKDNLTADEAKALSVGSDPDGGYFVTPDLTGRTVKKVYETSPFRQICSVQTISSDALQGMEDLGEAGAGYAGERAQGSDTTTPQVGKWEIPVFWIDTEPKATQQLLDDAEVDVEGWLAGKVGDKFGRFENGEFATGATKIRGLTAGGYTFSADSGAGVTWGQIGYVATGTSADFAGTNPGDKIFDLIGCVKDAYLGNARFLTRRSVITKVRKFKDGQGNYLWQPSFVMGQPEMIAGYPVTRAEDMPTLAANSYSLAFGDFREGYQIVDRQGIRVLRDPYTAKPYIKFYTTKRVGGGVVNFEAFKVMKFG